MCVAATAAIGTARLAAQDDDEADRVGAAVVVLNEMRDAPDNGIPQSIYDKAEAIAIFPSVKKAGFIVGGQWGRGIISVREPKTGRWSSPAFLTLTGGSFGAQLGGEVSAAAGPVGRAAEASTDLQLRAEILSYSRSRGLFAGATVNGSAIKEDLDANTRFYGRALSSEDIVFDRAGKAPASVTVLRTALDRPAR